MTSSVERLLRAVRQRLAGQLFLDRLTRASVIALAASLAWVLIDPVRWWVAPGLVLLAFVAGAARLISDYPARLAAALELDSRVGLRERMTAAVGLAPEQRETAVGRALLADADAHAARLRVAEAFPLRLPRRAWLVPVLAAAVACTAFLWHPVSDSGWFAVSPSTEAASTRPGDAAPRPEFPPPNPNAPDKSAAEKLAAIRGELDRLERTAGGTSGDDRRWVADLSAAEYAARDLERESLERLARMEAQLKQLGKFADSPDFKDGPGRAVAASLAAGDLENAEKAIGDLAKAAAEKPDDPRLARQVEQLREELRKAAENRVERDKLDRLIERAKSEGRDASGLEQDRDRLTAEARESQPLSDVADKLDAASRQLQHGNSEGAATELEAAGKKVRAVGEQAKAANEARAQAQRAERLRAEVGKTGGTGGLSDPRPSPDTAAGTVKDVRPRVPFVDLKGRVTAAGSGQFGGGFSPTEPAKLGPAIQQAGQSATASAAGQGVGRDDRDAVREFFERLGK